MAQTAAFDWAKVVDYSKRVPVEPPKTQYEIPGVTIEEHGPDRVPVVVVPLWHAVVTAKLTIPREAAALKRAQQRLALALEEIENIYPLGPHGIHIQVAYGLPYFRNYLPPALTDQYMPRSIEDGSRGAWAVTDAIRFPKDPPDLVLEQNDICFHFKSDYRSHIDDVIKALFFAGEYFLNGIPATRVYVGDLFTITSIRRGFVGRDMPRLIAQRLRIPGADKIPPGAELFMGFTSSHLHGLAEGNLPSFETIPGFTDQTPTSYFAHGTMMHLSHIVIDLERWYQYSYRERLHRMFNPRRTEPEGHLSPSQAPETSTFREGLEEDARTYRLVGHNEQMQFLSRVDKDTTTVYGKTLPKGTVFFLRQDFDTVENPFEFWAEGPVDPTPKPGVHFIGMAPSAQLFERMRREMDGVELQQRYNLPDENVGFTKLLTTTHRQNYLLPPRAHRAFPLAELL
jgi:hypothetical protein